MSGEIAQVRAAALPLEQSADLSPLLDRIGGAPFVLLGEASHGTHESYNLRAMLSERLVAECGFTAVALEVDQSKCKVLDECVRLVEGAPDNVEEVLRAERQWPSWMLANAEMVTFCTWLRAYNQDHSPEDRVGLHGLDAYPLWGALRGTLDYLVHELGWPADRVNDAFDAPLRGEAMIPPELIGAAAAYLARVLPDRVPAENAGEYYQNLLRGGIHTAKARAGLWLGRLGVLHESDGNPARVIAWAHNTHVGDARGTDSTSPSVGQLTRERYGSDGVVLVGFSGGSGSVIAAHERGAAMDTINVPTPRPDSVEALLDEALGENGRALFVFPEERGDDWLTAERGHRAMGVVYDPNQEIYVPTRLGQRYDALFWSGKTTPLQALHLDEARQGTLETLRISER